MLCSTRHRCVLKCCGTQNTLYFTHSGSCETGIFTLENRCNLLGEKTSTHGVAVRLKNRCSPLEKVHSYSYGRNSETDVLTFGSCCSPLEKVHSYTYGGNSETDVFTLESCCNPLEKIHSHTHTVGRVRRTCLHLSLIHI